MHAPQGPGSSGSAAPTAGSATGRGRTDDRLPPPRLTLRHGTTASGAEAPRRASAVAAEPDIADESPLDWRAVGLFTAGIAIGAMLGAGTALLLAPSSGFETRMRLARGARRARERAVDRWDDIEDRARSAARRSKRQLKRRLTLARWRAQDAWEQKRYGGKA